MYDHRYLSATYLNWIMVCADHSNEYFGIASTPDYMHVSIHCRIEDRETAISQYLLPVLRTQSQVWCLKNAKMKMNIVLSSVCNSEGGGDVSFGVKP